MSKIKIGAQVTAKVRHTNVTVSGTFQGYELEDQEDPTSVCGKVFYVKDGMQHLDYVYVDSIKVCKGEDEDERIRKELIEYLTHRSEVTGFIDEDKDCKRWIAYLEKQKEQKPAQSEEEKEYVRTLKGLVSDFIRDSGGGITDVEYYQNICDWLDGRHIEQKPVVTHGETYHVDTLGTQQVIAGKMPQKSAEWSEEDKTHLCWIIECFDSWKYQVPEFADQYQSAIDWLKSLRPDSYKNCNSRWKPSEEQMDWLESAVKLSIDKPHIHGIIISLYEQLKRL